MCVGLVVGGWGVVVGGCVCGGVSVCVCLCVCVCVSGQDSSILVIVDRTY